MTISSDTLFQILGLIGTLIAVIWYTSSILSKINQDLSISAQLNTMQEEKIKDANTKIKSNYEACKQGRIEIWRDLNNLKLKVAKLEAKDKS